MTKPVEVTLKPCPFCGGEAEKYTRENTGATADFCGPASHWIGCTGVCGASTSMCEEMREAITAWNTRHEATRELEADKAELVEALKREASKAFRIADEQNTEVVREAIHSMAHRLQSLAKHTGGE